ncbi:unnamed protein product, partial [Symbiodinium sp. CCMP2456]
GAAAVTRFAVALRQSRAPSKAYRVQLWNFNDRRSWVVSEAERQRTQDKARLRAQQEYQAMVESEVARRLAAARAEEQGVPYVVSLLNIIAAAIEEMREERRQAATATAALMRHLAELAQTVHQDT